MVLDAGSGPACGVGVDGGRCYAATSVTPGGTTFRHPGPRARVPYLGFWFGIVGELSGCGIGCRSESGITAWVVFVGVASQAPSAVTPAPEPGSSTSGFGLVWWLS